ncbi:MAG: D-alanine--D-alanine ligase [Proteobacteria bacterium]|nr:D-alanine--D-alanine ligase [Pseudomonadota bacterium]MDA0992807.1 D-alanine--D-alanine ligase [Pseudomonadota bacterium]
MTVSLNDLRNQIDSAEKFGRVAVMFGGDSCEREVSLDSGNAVLDALRSRGVDAHGWDPANRGLAEFSGQGFDRVWIALHGPGGEDGALQGALQWIDMPYTGSGVMASALAMDKVRSKRLFKAAGLDTPDYVVVRTPGDGKLAADELGFPMVIKPSGQGSSVGMSKIFEPSELPAAVDLALSFDGPAIAERCVIGTESTVAILQGQALSSIRIETPHVFYDYRAKYESDETRYHCPGTDDPELEQRFRDMAVAAFAALGCTGWGRVDFMTGSDGAPQLLEVNTVPGMTSHSLVPMAAKVAGIDFAELCWRVLETSMTSKAVNRSAGVISARTWTGKMPKAKGVKC